MKKKTNRTRAETEISDFLADPTKTLDLDVLFVAQKNRDFPPHLETDDGLFLCGTPYKNEEFTDGRLLSIALKSKTDSCAGDPFGRVYFFGKCRIYSV